MTTAVPRARQTALGAYRLLLRSVAQTFKGDESTLLAAKKEIRQKFEDSRGMSDEKARSDLIYGEAPQLSLACTPPSTPSSSLRTTGMTWLPLTRPFSLPPAKPPLSLSLSLSQRRTTPLSSSRPTWFRRSSTRRGTTRWQPRSRWRRTSPLRAGWSHRRKSALRRGSTPPARWGVRLDAARPGQAPGDEDGAKLEDGRA